MTSRTRLIVLLTSVPIITFTLIGGFLGRVAAGEDAYRHLRVFEDVVSLISSNYVETVDLDAVAQGALRGLADALDADSAYVGPEDTERLETGRPLPDGRVGLEVRRRYYVQVVAALDGSPAAQAGLLPGDYIRTIDGESTRLMPAVEGARRLRGEPGSTVELSLVRGNTAEPYDIELVRTRFAVPDISIRLPDSGVGYVRVPAFGEGTADAIETAVSRLTQNGATELVIDIRNNASGTYEAAYEAAIAAARLFVDSGTLVILAEQDERRTPIEATVSADAIETPVVLLINAGTAGPAEIFAAALAGRERAATIGQRTAGRASLQKLVRLPDGAGLWLSRARYLKPSGDPIHYSGIEPTMAVDLETVELGEPLPSGDPVLKRALEHGATSL